MAQVTVIRRMAVDSLSIETERLKGGGVRRLVEICFEVPGAYDAIKADLADDQYVEAADSLRLRLEENDPNLQSLMLGTVVQVIVQGSS